MSPVDIPNSFKWQSSPMARSPPPPPPILLPSHEDFLAAPDSSTLLLQPLFLPKLGIPSDFPDAHLYPLSLLNLCSLILKMG